MNVFWSKKRGPGSILRNRKAYKLMREEGGQYYPLYVLSDKPFVFGQWQSAESAEPSKDGKVRSKKGMKLAYRPGFHSARIPDAPQIGPTEDGEHKMWADCHWAEVELKDDIDYQKEADRNGWNPRTRKFNSGKAYLNKVPKGGFYMYKTSRKQREPWYIHGEMKVNRILSDSEVEQILAKEGLSMPRRSVRRLR